MIIKIYKEFEYGKKNYGILHIDLASDVRKMTYEETREHRKRHPYQIISKKEYNKKALEKEEEEER